jgi:histidine triad (HIT) family protein
MGAPKQAGLADGTAHAFCRAMPKETTKGHCTFCDLIKGAAEVSICHEDSDAIAFMDIQPVNNGHVLVVPRAHYESMFEVPAELGSHLFKLTMSLAGAIRKVSGCEDMNIVVSSGEAAGQDEPHYHVHIIPRRIGDGFDIPLPFGGSAMPDRTLLDAYAARIGSALRDPMKLGSAAEEASGRAVRRDTIIRPKLSARETAAPAPERSIALPTFSESERRADEAPRETPGDAAVYFLEEEGPHGELRYEPTSEVRDEA